VLLNLLSSHLDPITLSILLFFEVGSLLVVLSVHEAAHAAAAARLGDNTAKVLGRLTLNPLAHIDPMGGLMILLLGFGWGKAVPVNPYNLQSPRRDLALISFAGPASNFVMAAGLAGLFRLMGDTGVIGLVLTQLVSLNLALGIFNLLPISPLDGFKVVSGLLSFNLALDWEATARWGIFLLILLLMTPAFNTILYGPVGFLSRVLLGV
jgi:Zn-dependent protease